MGLPVTWQKLRADGVPMDQWPEAVRLEYRMFNSLKLKSRPYRYKFNHPYRFKRKDNK